MMLTMFVYLQCKNNLYLFISIYRNILKDKNLDINKWIDINLGFKSNGIEEKNILNIYLRYCYEGCINKDIKKK